jgi:PKD repeat protein
MKRLIVTVLGSSLLLLVTLLALSTQAQTAVLPGITSLTPNTGPNDQQIPITITGQGFTTATLAYLDDIPLLRVTFVDSATLQARVPFGLVTGVYTLTVTDMQSGTLVLPYPLTLANAFTVTQGSGWATGGPYGGNTSYLAIRPDITNTVFVVAPQSGVYRAGDGGQHWEQVLYSPAMWPGPVVVWPISPTVIFAQGQDGLYRSDQNGDPGSWRCVITETSGDKSISIPVIIAPSDPYTMYSVVGNTFYHSTDGGVGWRVQGGPLPSDPWVFWMLAVDHDDPETIYAATGQTGKVYTTTDAGQQWTLVYTLPVVSAQSEIRSIAADPYRPSTIWFGTQDQGLWRSIDGGATFTQVTPLPAEAKWIHSIRFDPNRDRIFVGRPYSGIYYSDNAGDSWQYLHLWEGGNDIAIAPGDSDTIYVSRFGMNKTTDSGQHWIVDLTEGIAAIRPSRIVISPADPKRVLMAAGEDGLLSSRNGSNEWEAVDFNPSTADTWAVSIDPVSPTLAYAGGGDYIFRTTDDGQSWQATANSPREDFAQFIAVNPQTHTTIYLSYAAANSLYRSEDAGDTWIGITTTGPISPVYNIVFAPGHPEVIYLGFSSPNDPFGGTDRMGRGILCSRDGGQTWQHLDSLTEYRVLALAVSPNDPNTLLASATEGPQRGIYISTNGGDSWQYTSGLVGSKDQLVYSMAYDPADARIVFAATEGGLRYSVDGGQSWKAYPGPMGQIPIKTLAISRYGDQTYLYLGTVGGVVTIQPTMLQAIHLNEPQATQSELLFGGGVYMKQGEPPPVAGFTAAPTSGVRPLTVVFADASTTIVTDWLWDFGDTFTGTQTNPTHTYSTTGAYTVTLTVSGPDGTDTLTRTNYITVYTPVAVGFTASPTRGLAPLTVVFTNTSTGDFTSSLWDLGDGVTSTLTSPAHIYMAAGVYTVTLTVSGPGGIGSLLQEDYIQVLHGIYLPLILRNP